MYNIIAFFVSYNRCIHAEKIIIVCLLHVHIAGRQYDKDGIQRMWWTEEAVKAFTERTKCFENQYSMYEMFGISVSVANVASSPGSPPCMW